MIEEDRASGIASDALSVATVPVRRSHGRLGAVVLGVVVAAVAFGGGLLVASPERPAPRSLPAAPETTRPQVTPTQLPVAANAATPRPSPTTPPGSSDFVTSFDLASVLGGLDGGQRCETGQALEKVAPRTRVDGPRLTYQRSWLVHCRIPPGEGQAFLIRLFSDLSTRIPAETFSYGTTLDGSGSALYPYAERPMAGTVALHAGRAGDGISIVLVIEEWRTG